MAYLEDIAAIIDAQISPLLRRVEQAERERDEARRDYRFLRAGMRALIGDEPAPLNPVSVRPVQAAPVEPVVEAVQPDIAPVAEPPVEAAEVAADPATMPSGLAELRAAIEKATGQKVAENFAPPTRVDDQIGCVLVEGHAMYHTYSTDPGTIYESLWREGGYLDRHSGGTYIHDYGSGLLDIIHKRLVQSERNGGCRVTIDGNEAAVWLALDAVPSSEWIGVHDLYLAACKHGWTLKEGALRARMTQGLDPISGHTDLVQTSYDNKLAFRLRYDEGGDTPPGDGTPAGADEWKARVAAIDPQLSARKRCPEAKRTDVWSLNCPAGYYLDLPAMHWGWSTDGRTNRVLRSHPFLDWLHATAVGDWGVVRGLDRTPSIHLTSEEDFARCVAAGLVTADERPALWGHWSIDLTGFDAELAGKEQSWKANAAKAQRSSKRCPRFARTVFQDDWLEARLAVSDWCPIPLKTLKRMPTWGLAAVERSDPVDPMLSLASGDYPTVLARCATMDKVWETASEDFIITGPTPESRGYGPTSIDNATLWLRPEDEVLMKIALA